MSGQQEGQNLTAETQRTQRKGYRILCELCVSVVRTPACVTGDAR
jgi:hypothetical protein